MRSVIEMAREAGGANASLGYHFTTEQLERFASLVREDEREACAKVCDEEAESWNEFDYACGEASATKRCAAAIRARSEA